MYPDRLGLLCVIDPNWVFKIAFTFMRPFLSQVTLDKVKLLGDKNELKEYIDEDEILIEHGGTNPFEHDPIKQYGLEDPEPE